jgi:hypothetical protein
MPITTRWYIENQVYYAKYQGDLTMPELEKAVAEFLSKYASVGKPIHAVIDWLQLDSYPMQLNKLRQLSSSVLNHPNVGTIVFVLPPHQSFFFMMQLLSRLFGKRMHVCKDLSEMDEYLKTLLPSHTA